MFKESDPIHFESWTGKNDPAYVPSSSTTGILVNSYQMAVQICLELLGTRLAPIPVGMPITASPFVAAAALRSGGHPFFMDIDPDTLCLPIEIAQQAAEEESESIFLLERPHGGRLGPALGLPVDKYPVVMAHGIPPIGDKLTNEFNIYCLEAIIGAGGLITHAEKQQLNELNILTQDLFGHDAALPQTMIRKLNSTLESYPVEVMAQKRAEVVDEYITSLNKRGKSNIIKFHENDYWSQFTVVVDDVKKAMVHAESYGITLYPAVCSLHTLPVLANRWEDKEDIPKFPNAMKAMNTLLALPCHPGIQGKVDYILDKVCEVI